MNHKQVRLLAIVPLALALSGCGVMQKLGLFRTHRDTGATLVVAPVDVLTQIGRSQLDGNNPGLAIKSFEQALASGERPAPALNGLGVAYAKIDRVDLAVRYFSMAAEAEPANEDYRANLAALYRSTRMARLRSAQDLAAANTEASKVKDFAVPVDKEGRIVRLSPVEVEIKIAPLEARRPQTQALVRIDLQKVQARRKRAEQR